MAKSVSSSLSDQATSLRSLKRLVVLLVVSNLALGIFSVYLLRSVDRRYSELVGHSVPALSKLQTLTAQAVQAMRTTGPTILTAAADNRGELVQRAEAAFEMDSDLRKQLVADAGLSSNPGGMVAFSRAGDGFTNAAAEVLRLYAAGDTAGALRVREAMMRPAFDLYLKETTAVSDRLEADSRRTSDVYSAKTGSISTIMLGLAGWPVLVFVALLLLVVALVIAMMVAFRGKDLADAP